MISLGIWLHHHPSSSWAFPQLWKVPILTYETNWLSVCKMIFPELRAHAWYGLPSPADVLFKTFTEYTCGPFEFKTDPMVHFYSFIWPSERVQEPSFKIGEAEEQRGVVGTKEATPLYTATLWVFSLLVSELAPFLDIESRFRMLTDMSSSLDPTAAMGPLSGHASSCSQKPWDWRTSHARIGREQPGGMIYVVLESNTDIIRNYQNQNIR